MFRVGDGITNLVLQENLQHTSGFGNFYRITLLECLGALKRAIWKVIRPNDVNRVNVSARLMSVGRLSVGMLLMGILRYHTRTCTEAIVCDLLAVPLALPVPSHTFSDIAYLYRWTHPAYPLLPLVHLAAHGCPNNVNRVNVSARLMSVGRLTASFVGAKRRRMIRLFGLGPRPFWTALLST